MVAAIHDLLGILAIISIEPIGVKRDGEKLL